MDRCEYSAGDECERLLGDEEAADAALRQPTDGCADRGTVDDCHSRKADDHRLRGFIATGQIVAYGLGHVFNDIAAAIWFSYTMVFMQNVIGMPPTTAGFLLFFG